MSRLRTERSGDVVVCEADKTSDPTARIDGDKPSRFDKGDSVFDIQDDGEPGAFKFTLEDAQSWPSPAGSVAVGTPAVLLYSMTATGSVGSRSSMISVIVDGSSKISRLFASKNFWNVRSLVTAAAASATSSGPTDTLHQSVAVVDPDPGDSVTDFRTGDCWILAGDNTNEPDSDTAVPEAATLSASSMAATKSNDSVPPENELSKHLNSRNDGFVNSALIALNCCNTAKWCKVCCNP
jgi:hypothetical protein